MRESESIEIIVTDEEDTDIVVLCAYAAHKINGPQGLKRQGSIYDCKKLWTEEVADAVTPQHANSGADAISWFWSRKEGRI